MAANSDLFSFFYDEQIRRYILQFIRIFSLIKIQSAPDDNGAVTESTVPIRYGDMSRMVANILRGNSESTIPSGNIMSAWISSLELDASRRKDPWYVEKTQVDERKFEDGEYTDEIGKRYTIEKHMAVPYMLTMQLDVTTLNTTTKLQILEQILMIFNPSIQIQTNDNRLDWSNLVEVELSNINWSNRSIPVGTDSDRDFASLTFKMPIWITPPAKVKRRSVIEQIVMSVYDVAEMPDDDFSKLTLDPVTNCFDLLERVIATPGNYQVEIGHGSASATELVLLTKDGSEDNTLDWKTLIDLYGEYQEDISFITLKTSGDIEDENGDVLGTFAYHPTKTNTLIYSVDVDTLPATISSGPIDQIIDPLTNFPDGSLPSAVAGQRYLLLEDIPDNTGLNPWGSVSGREQDIIEFNGHNWFISFDSSEEVKNQYVKSVSSYQHFKFTGSEWVHTYFGRYNPGYWRIHIQKCD